MQALIAWVFKTGYDFEVRRLIEEAEASFLMAKQG
jgi:hypothetical protein